MSKRQLYFYKNYFEEFFRVQSKRVRYKVLWTLRIVSELENVPEKYLKRLRGTSGIYEVRIRVGTNVYRVFCFFDRDDIIVVGHGFQKKDQKVPRSEILKAEEVKRKYYEEERAEPHQSK